MKRPRYGERVQVYLPRQLLRILDAALVNDGRTKSEFIRTAIVEAIWKIVTPSTAPPKASSKA